MLKMSLRAKEAAFGTLTLIEQLWVQLSLSGNDKLLIGCLYCSPTMSMRECSDELCQLLQTVHQPHLTL